MEIRIYCVRIAHYYSFGLTPEGAIRALPMGSAKEGLRVVEHVARPATPARNFYMMHRLPAGVVKAFVDDMGSLGWEGGAEGAGVERIYYDPNTGRWGNVEVQDTREGEDILDARMEPFDDAANTLESLTGISSTLLDTDDDKVRAKLKALGKRIRYALADAGI